MKTIYDEEPCYEKLAIIKDKIEIINQFSAIGIKPQVSSRPQYGTTIFIACCDLKMRMGLFRAYVFQDLIHKGYIIALAFGDIHRAKLLYDTRIHSSCVTSETLRGCDCDCSKQLEGALKRISEKGAGLLFYLIQEGRGVGYVAKARDRMLVQACKDELSTFEAYAKMGLKKDYRNYEGISSIIHLLGLKASFQVLTNNPDKVEALKALGIKVKGTEAIEFDAGPYNLAYLSSKAQSGHLISKKKLESSKRAIPPEDIKIFNPYALANKLRFIHCANYFLPMKPIDGEALVQKQEFKAFTQLYDLNIYQEGRSPLIEHMEELDSERMLVKMNRKNLPLYRDKIEHRAAVDLVTSPNWFKVFAYYDIATRQDFIVLEHQTSTKSTKGKQAVVRLHSESIFDRFPLVDVDNRDKFKASARAIVRNGWGLIVLLYNDGRGAGFGAHATDRMLVERNIVRNSDEAYGEMGLQYDSRDYDAAMSLISHHVPNGKIQMIMNNSNSLIRKNEYAEAMRKHKIDVAKWIFLE